MQHITKSAIAKITKRQEASQLTSRTFIKTFSVTLFFSPFKFPWLPMTMETPFWCVSIYIHDYGNPALQFLTQELFACSKVTVYPEMFMAIKVCLFSIWSFASINVHNFITFDLVGWGCITSRENNTGWLDQQKPSNFKYWALFLQTLWP